MVGHRSDLGLRVTKAAAADGLEARGGRLQSNMGRFWGSPYPMDMLGQPFAARACLQDGQGCPERGLGEVPQLNLALPAKHNIHAVSQTPANPSHIFICL